MFKEKLSNSYNFKVIYPLIAFEWNYGLNKLLPEDYYPTSKEEVFWKCSNNHIFKMSISYRVRRYREHGVIDCPICNKTVCSNYYNLMSEYPDIALEWDYVRNNGLTPFDITPSSAMKVWWICSFNHNHRWLSRVSNRVNLGRECPICKKTFKISYPSVVLFYYLYKTIPNVDFEVKFMNKYKIDILLENEKVAIEHDGFFYHNNDYSRKKDLIKIKELEKNGYKTIIIKDSCNINKIEVKDNIITYPFTYQYTYLNELVLTVFKLLKINNIDIDFKKDRINIKHFYIHMRKRKTLAYTNPELVLEWSSRNIDSIDTVMPKSSKKVYWVCSNCKNEYLESVINKVNHNVKCPYCNNRKINEKNNLAILYPELMMEWDYDKNKGIDPYKIFPGKELKVWWKCSKNHSWKTYIYLRTGKSKSGCPYCSGNKITYEKSLECKYSNVAFYWHPTLNDLTPDKVFAHSNKYFWWKCSNNHIWRQRVNVLVNNKTGRYCPFCRNR